eukprot:3982098-Pyramimonas_sp.AAC.1
MQTVGGMGRTSDPQHATARHLADSYPTACLSAPCTPILALFIHSAQLVSKSIGHQLGVIRPAHDPRSGLLDIWEAELGKVPHRLVNEAHPLGHERFLDMHEPPHFRVVGLQLST